MIQLNPGDGELFGRIFTTGILMFFVACIIVFIFTKRYPACSRCGKELKNMDLRINKILICDRCK